MDPALEGSSPAGRAGDRDGDSGTGHAGVPAAPSHRGHPSSATPGAQPGGTLAPAWPSPEEEERDSEQGTGLELRPRGSHSAELGAEPGPALREVGIRELGRDLGWEEEYPLPKQDPAKSLLAGSSGVLCSQPVPMGCCCGKGTWTAWP